ncbi:MAG TPA: periplasmic heavy metal sensor [Chthoniobacterales bacterium]|nr:periplasmic heavy metal sensor [Chthoniobacterales bacterium]
MKIKSLIMVSMLVGALQLSPIVFAQGPRGTEGGRGGRWQQRLANLTPEEREKLKAARQKAIQDPSVQAAHEKMRQARKDFVGAMHGAMVKADPSVQSILDKVPRGGRGGDGEEN